MYVKEIMSTEVAVVDRNDLFNQDRRVMVAKKLRHLPVLEDGKLLAIITQRDLLKPLCLPPWGMGKRHRRRSCKACWRKRSWWNP